MKSVFRTLVVTFAGQAVVLAVGIGEGFLLHWLVPSIELGAAILAATITAVAIIYLLLQVPGVAARERLQAEADADEFDEQEFEEEEDEDMDVVVEPLSELGSYRVSTPHTRRQKRKNRR